MKKYLVVFLILIASSFIGLLLLNYSGNDYVTIKDNKFQLEGEKFYPVTLNYIVGLQTDGKDFWIRPAGEYLSSKKKGSPNKQKSLEQFRADLRLIKQIGFNSIRIVGVGETWINEDKSGELSVGANLNGTKDTSIILSNNKNNYTIYFSALEEMFDAVDEEGLKAIFLIRMIPRLNTTADHLKKLAIHFKNHKGILAYDLFNEPLYFDKTQRTKESVFHEVNLWDSIFNANDRNHLTTIGLEGIREVFEWDPNILNVDFVSFHPYDHEPEQTRNEIYWYGKHVKVPWIIGETAIPADNDSVPYAEQSLFAAKTLKQAHDCGASGYSWWQYKDVDWNKFHSDFMGVVTKKGEVKPMAEEIKKFNPTTQKDSCICLSNYYNYSKSDSFRITGVITDSNNTAIYGAVILGWNEYWSHSYHTTTKPDGSFELLSSYPIYHWMISATEHSIITGDILPDTAKIELNIIPTIDMGEISIGKLPFLKLPKEK